MDTLLYSVLTPDERARLREVERKERRDERERQIAAMVDHLEQDVRALKALLLDTEGEGYAPDRR
jgi:hypothetical protein